MKKEDIILLPIPGIDHNYNSKLWEIFSSYSEIQSVILYGSRALGTYEAGSDIDLTVKGKNLSTEWLNNLAVKIDDLLMPYEVDISIFDHIQNHDLIEHINRVGIDIFKKRNQTNEL